MIYEPFRDTASCAVCGYARRKTVRLPFQLPCTCRGWVVFWRDLLAAISKDHA